MGKAKTVVREMTDAEILMTAVLIFPDEKRFAGSGAASLIAQMKRLCPKDRKCVAAIWDDGIQVVHGYSKHQSLPSPQNLVDAYREACAMRVMDNLVRAR
ncbi:MAG: hypothetical protein KF853_13620 [Rhodocyclaceae bacterium]|nr:hypothetical protein [Rhodocyclaceae bacterium]MBX3678051.1 hypothetical protein [Rhodocyclaceae bacterium]